ncbi:MAG: glycosyltransferase [Clostridia bacterium]|nr:glycosyltransferase [Clostridia bacterium]
MNKDIISIVVPIYKVENYLRECVESIKNQTYPNLEIILVDDGSPDNCGKICDELALEDNRIKVIHKVNGGLSDARNAGIDVATGEYIMFIDSDDLMELTACEKLITEIKNKNAQMVIGNYIYVNDDGSSWSKEVFSKEKYKNFKLDIKDYRDSFFVMNSAVWNKIYRLDFIRENNMKFIVGIPGEDAPFTTLYFIKSNDVYYINDIVYKYRQRGDTTSISNNCDLKYFKGISVAYKHIYNNFNDNNELGFYRFFYAKSMTYMLYKFIDSIKMSDDERIDALTEMRWFYKLSKELNVPACQESLSIIIDKIIEGRYREVIDICKVIADVRKFMTAEEREKMSKPNREMYDNMSENFNGGN